MRDPTQHRESDSTLEAIVAAARRQAFVQGELRLSGDSDNDIEWPGTESFPDRIGQYQVRAFLARGGSSLVFEAEQDNPPRRVAIKVLRDLVSDEAMRRFEFESRLLAKLVHPNIVRIYEVGQWQGSDAARPFIAMEYIGPQTLVKYADAEQLNHREKLCLLIELCAGVQHAHRHGIIHRDLKPTNVAVDESGCPKVLDFGVAKAMSGDITMHTKTGQWLGTPLYMSPEQLTQDPDSVDTRCDVYGLGTIGYELLSGKPPFQRDGRSIPQVIREICEKEPPLLGTVDPTFRGDVETIIATALNKVPSDRYESAAAFAADLQSYLDCRPIAARRIGAWGRLTRWAHRQPIAAIATLTAATLAVLLVVSFVVSYRNIKVMAEERHNQLYATKMNLAMQAFNDHNIDVAGRLLLQQLPSANEPDIRGFEWFHLWHQLHQHESELNSHLSDLYDIEFTSDGQRMISCGDGGWCLWDTSTWQLLATHEQPGMTFSSVLFVPKKDTFLTARYDAKVEIPRRFATHRVSEWELSTGRLLRESVPVPQQINSLAISSDGTQIFVGGGSLTRNLDTAHLGELLVLSMETFELINSPITRQAKRNDAGRWDSGINAIGSVIMISDHNIVTSHQNRPARIWDLNTGDSQPIAVAETEHSTFLDISPDRRLLAIGNWDEHIVLWDVASKKTVRTLPQPRPHLIRFSPDGSMIAATGNTHDNGIYLWDVNTGVLVDRFVGHSGDVWSLAFHPDGSKLLSGPENFSLFAWDLKRQHGPKQYVHGEGEIPSLDVSEDKKWLAFGSRNGTATVCETATGRKTFQHTRPLSHVWGAAIRPGYQQVAFGFADLPGIGEDEHPILVCDMVNDRRLFEVPDVRGACSDLAFSPDGRWLAATYLYRERPERFQLQVWDVLNWQSWKVENPDQVAINSLAFSPDSQRIATCGDDRLVRIWDARSGAALSVSETLPAPAVSVRYAPSGDQLAVGTWARDEFGDSDTEIRLLDASTLETQQIFLGHTGGAYGLAFSNDGKVLATGAAGGLVKLWSLQTLTELATLHTPSTGWVFDLEFTNDDTALYAVYGSLTDRCGVVRFDAATEHDVAAYSLSAIR